MSVKNIINKEAYLKGNVTAEDKANNMKLFVFGNASMYVKSNLLLSREDLQLADLKTLDAIVQAAYKAGKEGRPLMVALNEEVTT